MTDTPDLHTLAAEDDPLTGIELALYEHFRHLDCPSVVDPVDTEDCANMAVEVVRFMRAAGWGDLAAVLPAHRQQVLAEAADAITTLLDRYHQDLTLDTPADTAAYRAGRQAVTEAAALVRRLASAAPETAPTPRQNDETAPAAPDPTPGEPVTQPNQDPATLKAHVEATQTANDARLTALAQRGIQVNGIADIRLGMLCEHLLGDLDQPARLAFETKLQARYTEILDDLESQIARAQLLQGVNGAVVPPGSRPQ